MVAVQRARRAILCRVCDTEDRGIGKKIRAEDRYAASKCWLVYSIFLDLKYGIIKGTMVLGSRSMVPDRLNTNEKGNDRKDHLIWTK